MAVVYPIRLYHPSLLRPSFCFDLGVGVGIGVQADIVLIIFLFIDYYRIFREARGFTVATPHHTLKCCPPSAALHYLLQPTHPFSARPKA